MKRITNSPLRLLWIVAIMVLLVAAGCNVNLPLGRTATAPVTSAPTQVAPPATATQPVPQNTATEVETALPTLAETEVPEDDEDHLDPETVPQFVEPMVIPPIMSPVNKSEYTEYEVAVRQFEQQILPSGFPKTTV